MLRQVEVFFGAVSPAEAHVYARLDAPAEAAALRITGQLRGPLCSKATTLPATVSFQTRSGIDALLAEAIVPDPCYWTPELPHVYQVRVELHRGAELVQVAERVLGIRPLGVHGSRLALAGKGWVLRGLWGEGLTTEGWFAAEDPTAAVIVSRPDDALCAEASRRGLWLVAVVEGIEGAADVTAELARLARWPAVALAIVAAAGPLEFDVRRRARNLLLGQLVDDAAAEPASWADVLVARGAAPDTLAALAAGRDRPVVAWRPESAGPDFAAARAAIDRLQRDLAGRSDFAGYLA